MWADRLLTVLCTVALWEIFRFVAWKRLRERWQRSIGEWMRRHDLRLEQFRFIDRIWVRQALLQDAVLDRAAAERAAELGVGIGVVRARMEEWLDEIVPYFNLFSYYKLGGSVATRAVKLAYELVFDSEGLKAARAKVPAGAVTVYVANHRSNADYIILSVGAMNQVALSYAVGEWARVWPLDSLFRSFGSYLIRRGEKDPLYHKVLSRYLQLVAARGLTTAFFLEGGLSRDGAYRAPKIGLLDYLVGILRDDPTREIVFIPVAINYDRVLEDRNLTAEAADAPPPRWSDKLRSLQRIVMAAPRVVFSVVGPRWLTAHRKYGYATVQFGATVSVRELEADILEVAALDRKPRLARMAALADKLMDRVHAVMAATPVVVTARAILASDRSVADVRAKAREELAALEAGDRRLARGKAFAGIARGRRDSEREAILNPGGRATFDRDIVDHEEAERVVDLAFTLLRRRKLLRVREGRVEVDPRDEAILRYYARSIDAPAARAAGS
jgi:glycerol-3-phosphate O-acyltransferase